MDRIIYGVCPNCGQDSEVEGVDVGVGYVYPPLHCFNCGWSEHCHLYNTEDCNQICTEYENCCSQRNE